MEGKITGFQCPFTQRAFMTHFLTKQLFLAAGFSFLLHFSSRRILLLSEQ